ncbi:hypothetical protein C8J56DRAFT_953594 [Mycena floridula]|nr:hypothetical protein C8J56DRAFT_953594 [Mycena floridula]
MDGRSFLSLCLVINIECFCPTAVQIRSNVNSWSTQRVVYEIVHSEYDSFMNKAGLEHNNKVVFIVERKAVNAYETRIYQTRCQALDNELLDSRVSVVNEVFQLVNGLIRDR